MFKKLVINNFRIFEDKEINLGKVFTVIAGQNATGKSTILSLIGNSCEIKIKDGKTITNKPFKTQFHEIIKGSKTYDKPGRIGYILYDSNIYPNYMITMRVSWQSGERFRIIPKRMDLEKNKLTESKLPIPSFYLGLGRLYPLGEAPDENIQKFKTKNITSEEYSWLLDNYKNILSLDTIQVNSISNYTINKKTSGGINTETYDYLTNSCGQDNIMQILYILLSFQNLYDLYKKNNKHWEGGVFLIDELDATLHPAAQIRLLHVLYDEAKKLNLQIIFTTHSLHILEFLSTHKNWKSDVCISYFTTANNTLEIKENPEYSIMKDDMMITSFYDNITPKSITVYSEDEEARWMINNLLKNYVDKIRIININLGGDSLLDLLYNDPSYFENILFILDGDKNSNSVAIKYKNLYKRYRNIVTLPSEYPPEKMIYEYLINLPDNHEILANTKGVTKRIIRDNGPNSNKYQDKIKERERYKSWWKDNIYMIEDLDIISFWIKDNKKLYDEFIENFIENYNILASKNHISKIFKNSPGQIK